MNGLDDLLGMSIEHFAEQLEVTSWSGLRKSYLNRGGHESVFLDIKWRSGGFEELISDEFYGQRFDYDELLPIANELNISVIHKIAEMLAIRNAWIDYYKKKIDNPYLSIEELRTTISHDISFSFLILSSSRWWEHPWVLEQICLCAQHQAGDRAIIQAKEIQVEENPDIRYFIQEFKSQDNGFTTELEIDAYGAKYDVKHAKKRIADLHSEIKGQESIINQAMPKIRELKKVEKASIGHPKRTEEQQERSDIAKKFVGQWVNSLMDTLSIGSYGELAEILGGEKMTWWRWKNNKTLPPLRLLDPLLNLKIKSGKQKGVKLCDVQTTPSLRNLISLIELI